MADERVTNHVRRMRADWEQRARENARYYVATGQQEWSEEDFYRTGETNLREYVLSDLGNVCQGKDPKVMKVLEIGCGAGRITRALAANFGEVYAVDISAEMVRQARQALREFPRAHIFRNNGKDLTVVREHWWQRFGLGERLQVDFAFSYIVFQHIPSREVIESYVSEVHRLLRPGGLFKFQVQGSEGLTEEPDTWVGLPFSEHEAREMAERFGFEMRYHRGPGEEQYWLWFFKKGGERWLETRRRVGQLTVEHQILTDLTGICRGLDPKKMKVLDIGGDPGLMAALAKVFGPVRSVAIGGRGVEGEGSGDCDFAFCDIPVARVETAEWMLREVELRLAPGALFKFRLAGLSWTPEMVQEMAERYGFDPGSVENEGGEYLRVWFFKKSPPAPVVWPDEEFLRMGELDLQNHILGDRGNICRGLDPKEMTVVELGCGSGSIARAMAKFFGTVYGIDADAGEVARAAQALAPFPQARAMLRSEIGKRLRADFVFSKNSGNLEEDLRDASRLLGPGGLFKTCLPGTVAEGAAVESAARKFGFQLRFRHDQAEEVWLWLFKEAGR